MIKRCMGGMLPAEEVQGTADGEALSEFVLSVRSGTFFS